MSTTQSADVLTESKLMEMWRDLQPSPEVRRVTGRAVGRLMGRLFR